jgi:hypothetical protein
MTACTFRRARLAGVLCWFVLAATAPASVSADSLVLPGAAHTAGLAGTQWVTDLRVLNAAAEPATVTLTFTPNVAGATVSLSRTVAAGELWVLDDVVGATFGLEQSGFMVVSSSGPLVAGQRTLNRSPAGTYGQFIPAIATASTDAHFTGLRGGQFRSNLGVVNPSDQTVVVNIDVASGTSFELGPGAGVQLGGVDRWDGFDPGGESGSLSASGAVVSYASVVDNSSGDPAYVPGLTPITRGVVGGLVHGPGAQGTIWRTDLYLFAPMAQTVTGTLVFEGEDGTAVWPQLEEDLGSGETRVLSDVVDWLAPGREGVAVLWITSTSPLVAVARTYNQTDAGSFGQSMVATAQDEVVSPGERGLFLFAARDPSGASGYRSNLALVNPNLSYAVYTVELLDRSGAVMATAPVTVPSRSVVQRNDVVGWLGVTDLADGAVRVTGVQPFTGYLSSVDNRTGDAATVVPVAVATPAP